MYRKFSLIKLVFLIVTVLISAMACSAQSSYSARVFIEGDKLSIQQKQQAIELVIKNFQEGKYPKSFFLEEISKIQSETGLEIAINRAEFTLSDNTQMVGIECSVATPKPTKDSKDLVEACKQLFSSFITQEGFIASK